MKEKGRITKWLYWFGFAIAIIIFYKLLDNLTSIGASIKNLFGILMPFIMGALIAYILYIPCSKIEKGLQRSKIKFVRNKRRTLSIIIVYFIVLLLLVILVNCILPPVITSINDLINNIPSYYAALTGIINDLPEDSILVKLNVKESLANLASINFGQYVSIEYIVGYLKSIMNFATGIFDVFVTIIISIYTLSERGKIVAFFKKASSSLFGEEKYAIISKYFKKSNVVFFNFISGQLIDAVLIGIISVIIMSIMKVKYAVLLGFIIGLFNLIPFFGAIVAVGISIFITICTGGVNKAIWLAVVIIFAQQIDANIINPRILSDKLHISPILVIISVAVMGAYFGVLGMFLAVPIAAVIKIIVDDFIDSKNSTHNKIMETEINKKNCISKM